MSTTEHLATRDGEYVDAGGLRTYYETRGDGDPVLLLHGGLCTVETLDEQTPAIAQRHRVYVPERRAHGRTPDIEGPLTFEDMADDTVAFMDAVGLESAHLVGWSDGAYVGLQVALRNPERVRKLVYIGQNANPAGLRPEALPMLMGMTRETAPPIFEQLYSAVSPDGPEHFGVVFEKLTELWKTDQGIPLEELRGLSTPTLVVVGDDDIVSIEHAADMYRTIPDAQLAVVPGTSHALPMEKPDVLNRLVLDFFSDSQVTRMMPITTVPARAGS